MNLNAITKGLKKTTVKAGFLLKKYAPDLMVGAGCAGAVAGTVMACKATLKVNDILDKHNEDIEKINKVLDMDRPDYTSKDAAKDKAIVYTKTSVAMVKNYLPAAVMTSASIAAILYSHKEMHARNAYLSTCLSITENRLEKLYKKLESTTSKREADNTLFGIEAKEVGDDPKEVIEVPTVGEDTFTKFFDSSSREWDKDPEYNLAFLKNVQSQCNDVLRAQGILFLNDVYKMLDIPITKEGQFAGWIYEPGNYVDFGIFVNEPDRATRRFINGYENVVMLHFNCLKNIYQYM